MMVVSMFARASRIARMLQTRYAHDVTVFVTLDVGNIFLRFSLLLTVSENL